MRRFFSGWILILACQDPERCEKGKGDARGHESSRCPKGYLCSVYGVCFPKERFPKLKHNLKRGKMCYFDIECASQNCTINGTTAYGRAGNCE
jgi:hypothetical protein